jgi:hypothetical protein
MIHLHTNIEATKLFTTSPDGATSQAVDGEALQVEDDPKSDMAPEPKEGFDNYCRWGDEGGNNLGY